MERRPLRQLVDIMKHGQSPVRRRRIVIVAAAVALIAPMLVWWMNVKDGLFSDRSSINASAITTTLSGDSDPIHARFSGTADGPPRDASQSTSSNGGLPTDPRENYTPPAITTSEGAKLVVTSKKMPVAEGMFLSVAFIVIDPSDPHAAPLQGLAGVVLLENLTNMANYSLGSDTRLAIVQGGRRFSFTNPEVKWVNEKLKGLDYSDYAPPRLLNFLVGTTELSVEVNGRLYHLDGVWCRHLGEVIAEVKRQRRSMGYDAE